MAAEVALPRQTVIVAGAQAANRRGWVHVAVAEGQPLAQVVPGAHLQARVLQRLLDLLQGAVDMAAVSLLRLWASHQVALADTITTHLTRISTSGVGAGVVVSTEAGVAEVATFRTHSSMANLEVEGRRGIAVRL